MVSWGTAKNVDGELEFIPVPDDTSSITGVSWQDGALMTITVEKDGTSYSDSGPMIEAKDFFYAIGAPTYKDRQFFEDFTEGKTPEQFYNDCWDGGRHIF